MITDLTVHQAIALSRPDVPPDIRAQADSVLEAAQRDQTGKTVAQFLATLLGRKEPHND